MSKSGYYNPRWMLKSIVVMAPEDNVKLALLAVIDQVHVWSEKGEGFDAEVIYDIVAQVSYRLGYIPGDLDEEERQVEQFRQYLDAIDGFEVVRSDDPDGGCDEEVDGIG